MPQTPASTKAGRAAIVKQFLDVATKFGATVERRDESAHPGYSGAGTYLNFTLNGVGASVGVSDLHERHGQEGGLISWFNHQPPGEWSKRFARLGHGVHYFTPGFNAAVGEHGKSARPHHKATSCGSWDMLAARLQAGLRHAANGTAFLPDEAEKVA